MGTPETKMLQTEKQESFSRFASFICDFDDDEPFSDQDLRAIEAIETQFQSSLRNKRPLNPIQDDGLSGDDSSRHTRRRLPKSILTPLKSQGYERMRLPEMTFGGHISFCWTVSGAEKAARELLQILEEKKREMVQCVFGFDIEWRPSFKTGVPNGKVAMMQIFAGTERCYVLQIIRCGIPRNLQLMLEDPTILKVGVNIANDARKLFNDYKISVKGLQDLSFLANQKLGGDVRNWCLASLVEKLLSKELPKPPRIRLGNWESPTLSMAQVEYAAVDAFASWFIFQVLKDLPNAREAV